MAKEREGKIFTASTYCWLALFIACLVVLVIGGVVFGDSHLGKALMAIGGGGAAGAVLLMYQDLKSVKYR